jgi:hypothetical protein
MCAYAPGRLLKASDALTRLDSDHLAYSGNKTSINISDYGIPCICCRRLALIPVESFSL